MGIARIPETQAVNAYTDPGTGSGITESHQPFLKGHASRTSHVHVNGVWLCFAHSYSVAYRQHKNNRRIGKHMRTVRSRWVRETLIQRIGDISTDFHGRCGNGDLLYTFTRPWSDG